MGPDFHVVKESHSATEYAEPEAQTLDPELHYDDSEGYILDVNQLGPNASTKTAPDGQTVLIPQPNHSLDDPLNWIQAKKHTVLAVIIACTFLPDYGSVTGAITLIPQAANVRHGLASPPLPKPYPNKYQKALTTYHTMLYKGAIATGSQVAGGVAGAVATCGIAWFFLDSNYSTLNTRLDRLDTKVDGINTKLESLKDTVEGMNRDQIHGNSLSLFPRSLCPRK
ncbi:MAG: hypothetical protein Q9198_003819 [Flavoplaca austrocitrina]